MKNRIIPTQVEHSLTRDSFIVSKTDTKGRITYANRTFMHIAGYREDELLGKQHNIVRPCHRDAIGSTARVRAAGSCARPQARAVRRDPRAEAAQERPCAQAGQHLYDAHTTCCWIFTRGARGCWIAGAGCHSRLQHGRTGPGAHQ